MENIPKQEKSTIKPCVKGSLVNAAKKYVLMTYGEEGLKKVIAKMTGKNGAVVDSTILDASWIPEEINIDFLNCATEVLGRGSYEVARQIGRFEAQITIPTLYKVFVRMGDPGFVVQGASRFWKTVHNTGQLKVVSKEKGSVTMRLIDFGFSKESFCSAMLGYCQAALELSGAKKIEAIETKCMSKGDQCCEYSLKWK